MKKDVKKKLRKIKDSLYDLKDQLEEIADDIDEESIHDVDPDYETAMSGVDRINDARSYIAELIDS
jgi:gas vesicle protein